jgi:DNA-binding helix-hairpin-helix protein with protein kinase domain
MTANYLVAGVPAVLVAGTALWFWAESRGLKRLLASSRTLNRAFTDQMAKQAGELFEANSELMRLRAAEDRRQAQRVEASSLAGVSRHEKALARRARK